jgi:hypothetical protein
MLYLNGGYKMQTQVPKIKFCFVDHSAQQCFEGVEILKQSCFKYKIPSVTFICQIPKTCCIPMVAALKCKTQRICKIKIFILSILALNSVFEVGNF